MQLDSGPNERTVFILGSKGVGKSTVVNKFFDREENSRPTLALEYSYGRRTSSTQHAQKQILNVWELGSLENTEQLIEVPLRTHGIENFAAIIMLDLGQPQRIWLDLEYAYKGLKYTVENMLETNEMQQQRCRERASERIKREHPDIATLELMPFPVIIVGGKYDIFKDFDPAIKKHICRCLRSMSHLIGGSLLFYSQKIPKQAKILRDTISHLGFGSPTNPFRSHITDYNDALSIWFGNDSWARIDDIGPQSIEHIGVTLGLEVPQLQSMKEQTLVIDPSMDAGFKESIIDEMRAQKNAELATLIRDAQLRGNFESITT